uniref:HDC10908 n=1 Tax=Drosophila melanogaster TaxID=7227 RepID=Q6IL05_DROME|nr:TPA_inf: HDC10908 [Drosophila melanogaster]
MAKCECLLAAGLVPLMLTSSIVATWTWRCLYKEFPVDVEKVGMILKFDKPKTANRVDLYWTRITQTDFTNYAVELHCSLPWMRHQMAIYTRKAIPSEKTLEDIAAYLKTVDLTIKNFSLIRQNKDCRSQKPPIMQRWHLSRYLYMDYNPVYVKPLVENENI